MPAYRDNAREYLEIAVLRLALRAPAKATRLVELVHRAVPYPPLLLTELAGDVVAAEWDEERDAERWPAFRDALALGELPRTTLHALYQGWIDTLLALQAARVTGTSAVAADAEHAAARRDALQDARASTRRSPACVPPPRKRSRSRR